MGSPRSLLRTLVILLLPTLVSAATFLQLGEGLPGPVAQRVVELLTQVEGVSPAVLDPQSQALSDLPAGSLLLSLGETPTTRRFLDRTEVEAQGPEGFVLLSRELNGVRILVGDGKDGLAYVTYAALEHLGFAFLHPLVPALPTQLCWPGPGLEVRERPHWPVRGIHLHTMHPTELTELLNGFGPGGAGDLAGWEAWLPRWERVLEWSLANRQNLVEWVLLEDRRWLEFSRSPERQARLRRLVERAHAWGLEAGIDAPVALAQQNGWRLVRQEGNELEQIEASVDWLLGAGFDVVNTELGFSEFHSPDEVQMLAWLDHLTERVHQAGPGKVTVKIHCSNSEKAKHHKDPETGKSWNMNFLPYYADPRLEVMVHTVQHYGLDDPAPTYGNQNFAALRRYLQLEAGRRPVLWYPETAYWVSFDIDVPLFLPLYAERRLHDLRLLAADELAGRMGRGEHAGSRMQGQVFFSSGWEWGYWLNDVVTARAAWDPRLRRSQDQDALQEILEEALAPLGEGWSEAAALLGRTAEAQHRLLILGDLRSLGGDLFKEDTRSEEPEIPLVEGPLTGQAYLQGVETWDDVADLIGRVPLVKTPSTQPRRLGPISVRSRRGTRHFRKEIRPLLVQMEEELTGLAEEYRGIEGSLPASSREWWSELADAAEVTGLRARQILALYDVACRDRQDEPTWKELRLRAARTSLDQASQIVRRREARYRVPADEIAGWQDGATVYPFRYLWTVRSLYYWWRDEAKVTRVPRSPCFLNIMNPAEVATAEGVEGNLFKQVEWIADKFGWALDWAQDCLHPPAEEPDFSLLRE